MGPINTQSYGSQSIVWQGGDWGEVLDVDAAARFIGSRAGGRAMGHAAMMA